jgi:hypothetical protein
MESVSLQSPGAWLRLAVLLLAIPPGAGCGLFRKTEEQHLETVTTKAGGERAPITIGELDQMTRNFSDRLVARVSTACDQIKNEASDDAPRSKAHQLKLSVALAAYDIVSSPGGSPQVPGAAQHLIDLAILTELETLHWGDEGAGRDQFGERGGRTLVESFQQSREDIGQIAGRIMAPQQLDTLKTLVAQWRARNPKVEWLARVRFDIIAQGNEAAGFRTAIGETFNPIQSVTQSADEMRMVSQQALFYLHRLPLLLDWTTEATISDALEVPKLSGVVEGLQQSLQSLSRMTTQLEQLMQPSSQEPAVNSTVREVKDSLSEARGLVGEVHRLEEALQPYLEKANRSSSGGKPTDYEAVATRVNEAARSATSLVQETRMLAESPEAVRNLDDTISRLRREVATSEREVIDHATWRAVQLIVLIVLLVVLHGVIARFLKKR